MGIDVAALQKGPNKASTPLQAHSRYLPIGGKNTKCRCKTDCSKHAFVGKLESFSPNTVTRQILSTHGVKHNSNKKLICGWLITVNCCM
jgi:hypothetical protein